MVVTALPLAFAVAVVATPLAGRLAHRLGILDRPGPLKVHAAPVPYLGGLGVLAGLAAAAGWVRPALFVPLALALVLGVLDDRHDLSPAARLAGELAIAGVAGGLAPTRLPGLLGPVATAVAVVVLVNAVNLIDGLDGLAAGVGLVSALGFAVLLDGRGRGLALALGGALAGFLVHNRPPARIYLGDGGAYLVGTALALLLALAWDAGRPPAVSAGALAMVVVPVGDILVAVVRRRRAGQPLFAGDRGHTYDQLVDRGWPAWRAALALVAAQAGLAAAGAAAGSLGLAAAVALVTASAAALVAAVAAGGFLAPTYRRSVP